MYRPQKRKLVHRIGAASVVVTAATVSLGAALVVHHATTNPIVTGSRHVTANPTSTGASNPSPLAPPTKATTPVYHIVGPPHHDDARSRGDGSASSSDN